MSVRSILHFNHDYPAVSRIGEPAFLAKIGHFIRSGRADDLPEGVSVVWHGHHSGVDGVLKKLNER